MEHRLVVCFRVVHPGRLMVGTYKSPMKGKENHLNQTSMIVFHVNLQGCSYFQVEKKTAKQLRQWMEGVLYHLTSMKPCIYRNILHISTGESPISFINTLFAPKLEGPAGQILSVCSSMFFGNHLAVKGKDMIFPCFPSKKKIPTFPGLVKTQCFHDPRH